MKQKKSKNDKKNIFQSIFFPMFIIMIIQAAIFYIVAVYGGIEETLSKNTVDIVSEKLNTKESEIENQLNNKCFDLDSCLVLLQEKYLSYEEMYGNKPLTINNENKINFLKDCSNFLIDTLRQNEVNGLFLIINDQKEYMNSLQGDSERKYGLGIRDLDQDSNYSGRNDLLIKRCPLDLLYDLDCPFDTGVEPLYTFTSKEEGDYYYYPLDAAWNNTNADCNDLGYFSGIHQIASNDLDVVSYSIPLISKDGYPYGVVGVELTKSYITSLLVNKEVGNQSCFIIATKESNNDYYQLVVGSGKLYDLCYRSDANATISCDNENKFGGFDVIGRGNIEIYVDAVDINIYNNNNPFEDKKITLLSLVESKQMFAYINKIKITLLVVSLVCLVLGSVGIFLVSRMFARPITKLAISVQNMNPKKNVKLKHLGIKEIDQLVNAIEELNQKANKTSARTEFFSRMSHDMRTPMNAIISFSSPDMLEGIDEKTKDEYLIKIQNSSKYMLGLINEVLDMTKIESNSIMLNKTNVKASSICDTVIPMVKELASKKGINFIHNINIDNDLYVNVDKQRLNQIIINLLSNAIKFTDNKGTVILEVRLGYTEDNMDKVNCQIIVSDTGKGMSKEFLKKLYTPFEQENSAIEGTGLGLAITKKLVQLMNGVIDCNSIVEKGTTFKINIPLEKCIKEEVNNEIPKFDKEDYVILKGKHILICEDNEINAMIVSSLLNKFDITVNIAQDGNIGLEMFKASKDNYYDFILMDIRMPNMDGLTATKEIRKLNRSDAASIPIIAMTANAFDEDMQECIAAGMNEHLSKPIDTDIFFNTLVKYVKKK